MQAYIRIVDKQAALFVRDTNGAYFVDNWCPLRALKNHHSATNARDLGWTGVINTFGADTPVLRD